MRSNFFYRLSAVLCILLISLSSNAQARHRRHAGTSARQASAVETITVKGVSFKMIRVEGMDNINTFSIGETEVTQKLWQAVMGSNPSYHEGPRFPVEEVSWNDCQEFITKLNKLTGRKFRLPTEAEWEYAARGGKKSKGYKYSGSDSPDDVAWYENKSKKTQNVGTKRANELGIYDMSGNVWEWCQDGDDNHRAMRGGSLVWNLVYCEVLNTGAYDPEPFYHFSYLGLRLAL